VAGDARAITHMPASAIAVFACVAAGGLGWVLS